MKILIPSASARPMNDRQIRLAANLDGKKVAIVSNGWRSMDAMVPRLSEGLKARGVSDVRVFSVRLNTAITAEVLSEVRANCDFAIVGLAN